MTVDLKTLNTLKNEIEHLEEAAELLDLVYNCFDSHYEFRRFVESHNKFTTTAKGSVGTRIDNYFNFDDSE